MRDDWYCRQANNYLSPRTILMQPVIYSLQPLAQRLQQSGQCTTQQFEGIRSGITVKTLRKGEHFPGVGGPVTQIAFVLKGILRVFTQDHQGFESTVYFIDENNFAIPGLDDGLIQAAMITEIAILSPEQLIRPSSSFGAEDWNRLAAHIEERVRFEKNERIGPNQGGDATTRYRKFMDKYPQIAGRVPLSLLASYLGITQQSLSRVRKQLTHKKTLWEE